jgi:hypothetical protein
LTTATGLPEWFRYQRIDKDVSYLRRDESYQHISPKNLRITQKRETGIWPLPKLSRKRHIPRRQKLR